MGGSSAAVEMDGSTASEAACTTACSTTGCLGVPPAELDACMAECDGQCSSEYQQCCAAQPDHCHGAEKMLKLKKQGSSAAVEMDGCTASLAACTTACATLGCIGVPPAELDACMAECDGQCSDVYQQCCAAQPDHCHGAEKMSKLKKQGSSAAVEMDGC